jgi:hypothetical protein
LNTSPDTVRLLHRSYITHLYILHPFLDKDSLETKIEDFIETYRPPQATGCPSPFPSTGGILTRSAKRQRLTGSFQATHEERRQFSIPEQLCDLHMERTIDNAIVFFILGLGSICEWKNKPLSGVSPNLGCSAWGPSDTLSSQEGSEDAHPKNMKVIPGLAYYAAGKNILDDFKGEHCLVYIQATLLAGVYAGQLAHPTQSFTWIADASQACLMLLQS